MKVYFGNVKQAGGFLPLCRAVQSVYPEPFRPKPDDVVMATGYGFTPLEMTQEQVAALKALLPDVRVYGEDDREVRI